MVGILRFSRSGFTTQNCNVTTQIFDVLLHKMFLERQGIIRESSFNMTRGEGGGDEDIKTRSLKF